MIIKSCATEEIGGWMSPCCNTTRRIMIRPSACTKRWHLVMIRNWVGQVGRDEFYQACDKYGILIWNDFWLANPADGAAPTDAAMFIANMRDKILQIRNHPSLALYCGRNEGNPPKDLDDAMRQANRRTGRHAPIHFQLCFGLSDRTWPL